MSDTLLYDLARRLLEVSADALDSPPDRQHVTDGTPMDIVECPSLTVALAPQRGLVSTLSNKAGGTQNPRLATMRTSTRQAIYVVRLVSTVCWPSVEDDGGVPTAAEIDDAAQLVLTDRFDLWTELRDQARADPPTLFAGLLDNGVDGVDVSDPVPAVGPAGGTAGTVITVTVDLMRIPTGS